MLGLDMLDVAIGTIFVFLLLSLICTAVNEIIESVLKTRARELERGIGELLRKQGAEHYDDIVEAIYNHPLISSLYRGDDYDEAKKNNNLPAYIPTRNFALALLDIVTPSDNEAAAKRVQEATETATAANKPIPSQLTPPDLQSCSEAVAAIQPTTPALPVAGAATLPASNQTAANTAVVAAATPESSLYKNHSLETVRETISQIQNPKIKGGLLPLIDAAENNVDQLRANVEDWYNSTMDRVSGWYKRKTQWWMIGLGLSVAIIVNADTISIVNSLTRDPAVRNSLVAASQEYVKVETDAVEKKDDEGAKSAREKVQDNLNQINKLGLPIGWSLSNPRSVPQYFKDGTKEIDWLKTILAWLLKVIGWLITAAAISLGAPFWFDLLNKFMVVRSTVKPAEKSPKEKSKS